MITPTDKQREFIESNLPALTWETPGFAAGGTTALVLAAMRDVRVDGYRALLLKGHAPDHVFLVDDIRSLAPQCGLTEPTTRTWTFSPNGGSVRASGAYSITLMDHETFDFIGIDDVEYVGLRKLKEIAKHLRHGGRLRCTRHTQCLDELLGPRMTTNGENPFFADAQAIERLEYEGAKILRSYPLDTEYTRSIAATGKPPPSYSYRKRNS